MLGLESTNDARVSRCMHLPRPLGEDGENLKEDPRLWRLQVGALARITIR